MLQGYGSEVSQAQVNAEIEALIELYEVQALELPTAVLADLVVHNRHETWDLDEVDEYEAPDDDEAPF